MVYSGDIEKDGENPWFPSEKIYTWWVKTTLICYFTEGYTFWWWRIIKIITIMNYELKIITIMSWDGDELKSPHLCHDINQPQQSPKNLSTFPVGRFYSWTRWPNSFCKICLASFATETVSDRVIIVHPAKEIIEWINREDGYCRTHCRWLIFVGRGLDLISVLVDSYSTKVIYHYLSSILLFYVVGGQRLTGFHLHATPPQLLPRVIVSALATRTRRTCGSAPWATWRRCGGDFHRMFYGISLGIVV